MMHNMLHQAASNAMAMGPAVLVQGMQLQRPMDVVKALKPFPSMTSTRSSRPGRRTFTLLIRSRSEATFLERRNLFQSMRYSLPSKNSIGAGI